MDFEDGMNFHANLDAVDDCQIEKPLILLASEIPFGNEGSIRSFNKIPSHADADVGLVKMLENARRRPPAIEISCFFRFRTSILRNLAFRV